jgi:hypothetical protein
VGGENRDDVDDADDDADDGEEREGEDGLHDAPWLGDIGENGLCDDKLGDIGEDALEWLELLKDEEANAGDA